MFHKKYLTALMILLIAVFTLSYNVTSNFAQGSEYSSFLAPLDPVLRVRLWGGKMIKSVDHHSGEIFRGLKLGLG